MFYWYYDKEKALESMTLQFNIQTDAENCHNRSSDNILPFIWILKFSPVSVIIWSIISYYHFTSIQRFCQNRVFSSIYKIQWANSKKKVIFHHMVYLSNKISYNYYQLLIKFYHMLCIYEIRATVKFNHWLNSSYGVIYEIKITS